VIYGHNSMIRAIRVGGIRKQRDCHIIEYAINYLYLYIYNKSTIILKLDTTHYYIYAQLSNGHASHRYIKATRYKRRTTAGILRSRIQDEGTYTGNRSQLIALFEILATVLLSDS
jgi:hypothetical protein